MQFILQPGKDADAAKLIQLLSPTGNTPHPCSLSEIASGMYPGHSSHHYAAYYPDPAPYNYANQVSL
eukprot:scaffold660122_cov47-Prasinocladus_malaysianus.AAC.2